MSLYTEVNNFCEKIASMPEKTYLRGEVAFDRWYFHYQPDSTTKELGQVSSRIWAVAYTLESLAKAVILAISILIYGLMGNELEIETRCEVLKTQGESLLHSLCAIISPETARDAFKESNTLTSRIKSSFKPRNIFPSNYTLYTGEATLNMLINTH